MPETTTPQLSESDVEAMEAANKAYRIDWRYPNQRKRVDALIRDWRALKAELDDYEQTDLVPRTRYNAADAEAREAREMVKTLADKARVAIERLESENTALREQLAETVKERDQLRNELDAEYERQAGADL